MKKLPIAAAALLFGASTYALAQSTEPTGVWVDKDPYMVTGTTALGASAAEAMQVQPADVDWWDADKPAFAADEASAELKATDEVKADLASSDDLTTSDEEWEAAAAAKAAADGEVAVDPEVEADMVETTALDEEPVPVEDGVGGPYEVADSTAATPRAAAQNYPACRPGPGDDRCIQLYEPGVREELASWNQPTGGLARAGETQVADSSAETERLNQLALAESTGALESTRMAAAEPVAGETEVAMGGPYEPVDEAALMNGDGEVDSAMGETEADEEAEV